MSSPKPNMQRYDWRTILKIALAHKPKLIAANLVALLATTIAVFIPLLMPFLIDEVLLNKAGSLLPFINYWIPENWQKPLFYIGAVFVLTLVLRFCSLALNIWQLKQFTQVAKEVTYSMRLSLLNKLERISMAEYERLGAGKVSSHFVTDINTVDTFIGSSLSYLIVAIFSVLGTAVVLFFMHWQLALFILFFNPLVVYATRILGKRVGRLKSKENKTYELFQGLLTETLSGIQQLRVANREQHYLKRLIGSAEQVRESSSNFAWKSEAAGQASFTLFIMGVEVFRAAAMLMVLFSDLSIGEMLAVYGYLWFLMEPIRKILNIQYNWYGAKAALERINNLLGLTEEPNYSMQKNPFLNQKTASIKLENVDFSYHEGKPILQNVSLEIPAGKKVALVGISGGGKSSLVQAMLGLYPMQKGSVSYSGVNIEAIGHETVREHVATVLQQPVIFSGSIRSNLLMGQTHSDQELWDALRSAQLADAVQAFPEQLDTDLGTDAVRLSGGQRQRLAIARMLLSNPKVVILDEATSALDMITEEKLHQALTEFLAERTCLIIAHRLSAIKQAEYIYVLKDGQIIETGSHKELLAKQGVYATMYTYDL